MFEMRIADVVTMLTRQNLPRSFAEWNQLEDGTMVKPGVHFELDLRMWDLIEDDVREERSASVHFVMCGNVNTFAWHTEKRGEYYSKNLSAFENISNHDSCWRSEVENKINGLYFKWAEAIRHKTKSRKAPKDMSTHTSFGIGSDAPSLVTVHYKAKPKDEQKLGNIYNLVKLEPRTVG